MQIILYCLALTYLSLGHWADEDDDTLIPQQSRNSLRFPLGKIFHLFLHRGGGRQRLGRNTGHDDKSERHVVAILLENTYHVTMRLGQGREQLQLFSESVTLSLQATDHLQ